jgi:tRNA pseudouridine55 synthase
MDKVFPLNKPAGLTPLQAVEQLRKKHPHLSGLKLGYAGRLDPMAEGLMLVLIGEENKNKTAYLNLSKEYEVDILLGLGTDSGDILGLLNCERPAEDIDEDKFLSAAQGFLGSYCQTYPAFSTKTVQGQSLHVWAREDRLSEIELPTQEVLLTKIILLGSKRLKSRELLDLVQNKVALVSGDFRQAEILARWQKKLSKDRNFPIFSIRVSCAAGAYMRQLAQDIGQKLSTCGLALAIKRTRVGDFKLTQIPK